MSSEWKWFVGFVMGGRGVTHSDNDGPLKWMRCYWWWRAAHFMSFSLTFWHERARGGGSCTQLYAQTQLAPRLIHQHERTHTQGRSNMINGGVSLTLINYNQIKDFISFNVGSAFGHTVNQRSVIFALHHLFLFLSSKVNFQKKKTSLVRFCMSPLGDLLSQVTLISVKRCLCLGGIWISMCKIDSNITVRSLFSNSH